MQKNKKNEVTYLLRIPTELHTMLSNIAAKEMRSLHGQILIFLKQGVEKYDKKD